MTLNSSYGFGLTSASEILTDLGIPTSQSKLRALSDDGVIPYRRTEGGHRRFSRADLEKYARKITSQVKSIACVAIRRSIDSGKYDAFVEFTHEDNGIVSASRLVAAADDEQYRSITLIGFSSFHPKAIDLLTAYCSTTGISLLLEM